MTGIKHVSREGEEIIALLQSKESLNSVTKRVENFLKPVLQSNNGSIDTKYEVFSFKFLRESVKLLPETPDTKQQQVLLNIAQLCCSALDLCDELGTPRAPLSYETLLIHFAKNCLLVGNTEHCLSISQQVTKKLNELASPGSARIKQAFDNLWFAIKQFESKGKGSDECVLKLRKEALLCLHASKTCGLVSLLELVGKQFPAANSTHTLHLFQDFHSSLLSLDLLTSDFPSKLSCPEFVQCLQYLLNRSVLATKLDMASEGKAFLNHSLTLSKKHCTKCNSTVHKPATLQVLTVGLWSSILESKSGSISSAQLSQLRRIGEELHSISQLKPNTELISLYKSLGILLHALKTKREANIAYFHPSSFGDVKCVLLACVDYAELLIKTHSSNRLSLCTTQLQFLRFLAIILQGLLENNVVEVLPGPNCPKDDALVDSCLPILLLSHEIIAKNPGLLPSCELKWLANRAYYLAESISGRGLYQNACQILEFSCKEFLTWCHGVKDYDTLQEAELHKRFRYLARLYANSGDYPAAVETLAKALKELPPQLVESEATAKVLVNSWTNLQLKVPEGTAAMIYKSLLSVLGNTSVPLKVKILYLQMELSSLQKSYSQAHSALVTVTLDLCSLYDQQDNTLLSAFLTVSLATLTSSCSPQCTHQDLPQSPLDMLEKALDMLSILLPSQTQKERVHQGLGSAYLWKAFLTAEISSKSVTSEKEAALSDGILQHLALLCSNIKSHFSCQTVNLLSKSVEAWKGVWLSMCTDSAPLELGQHFYEPAQMLEDMFLTALVCSAHYQSSLALQCLTVLVNICSSVSESASGLISDLYSEALALFIELSAEEEISCPLSLEITPMTSLHCQAALIKTQLSKGKLTECKAGLLALLDHPSLSTFLCAKAKLLASEYLLHRHFKLKSATNFFRKHDLCPPKQDKIFRLVPLELAMDATKLLWRQAHHDGAVKDGVPFSCSSSSAWLVLWSLLRALLSTSRLCCLQGLMDKAWHYARDGARLAKDLHLQHWYVEFLLVMIQVLVQRDQLEPAHYLFSQVALLLDCSELVHWLITASSPPPTTPVFSPPNTVDTAVLHTNSDVSTDDSLSAITTPPSSPIKEHPPPLTSHPDSCTSAIWLYQLVKLVCLMAQSSLKTAAHHVTVAMEMINDFLTQHTSQVTTSSLEPFGLPQIFTVSRSKATSRRRKGAPSKSTAMKRELLWAVGETACVRGLCLLSDKDPHHAVSILEQGLLAMNTATGTDYISSHLLANLHYLVAQAELQQLEADHLEVGMWPDEPRLEKTVEELMLSYQLCFPAMPAVLLRDTSLWLGTLLEQPDLAHHFLSLSQQISLTRHRTLLTVGSKIRKMDSPLVKTPAACASETEAALTTTEECGLQRSFHSVASPALLEARAILHPPSSPLTPHHTASLLSLLPLQWTILTLILAPKPHPSSHTHLIITEVTPPPPPCPATSKRRKPSSRQATRQASKQQSKPTVNVRRLACAELDVTLKRFEKVMSEAREGLTLTDCKQWWRERRRLDDKLKCCLSQLDLAYQEKDVVLSSDGPVLLVLGHPLQHLPWESLPTLQDTTITRTPSLTFAAAHKTMVSQQECDLLFNVCSTYFVVNPKGDLQKTEKCFKDWFSSQEGWKGVVGKPPDEKELTTALQEKDLYIYAGHSAGHFLSDSALRSLHYHATTLLMGCSTARLTVDGQCDPSGLPLLYLQAGCPTLLGCLWDITDGEIDRFCKSLVQSLLTCSSSGDQTMLSSQVTSSRSACRTKWLVGSAPVLYGLPCKFSSS